jgi:hypothetical protein
MESMTRPDPIRTDHALRRQRIVFTRPGDEGRRNASVIGRAHRGILEGRRR